MEPGRGEFLTGASFAKDQHRPVDRRHTRKPLLKIEEGLRLAKRLGHSPAKRLDFMFGSLTHSV